MTTLKLEVGKTYTNRNGVPVKIGSINAFSIHPCLVPYYMDGRYTNDGVDSNFDLISEYTPPPATLARMPHKWATEMHAFADGYEIEAKAHGRLTWNKAESPAWYINYEYRIKPEPTPLLPNDVRFIALGDQSMGASTISSDDLVAYGCKRALRIEFNPNDQTLVSASVVTL